MRGEKVGGKGNKWGGKGREMRWEKRGGNKGRNSKTLVEVNNVQAKGRVTGHFLKTNNRAGCLDN